MATPTNPIQFENAILLAIISDKWMSANGLPANCGFEEAVSDSVLALMMDYYHQKGMVFDLEHNPVDEDAIVYAFTQLQEIHNSALQAAVLFRQQMGSSEN